LNIEA